MRRQKRVEWLIEWNRGCSVGMATAISLRSQFLMDSLVM